MEFHQTEVGEVTDEIIWFWRSRGNVKVTARSDIWVSYCSGQRHPHRCLGIEVSSPCLHYHSVQSSDIVVITSW